MVIGQAELSALLTRKSQIMSPKKNRQREELILDLKLTMDQNPYCLLEYKLLEIIRGYIYHLAMVFEIIFQLLKEVYLTLSNLSQRETKKDRNYLTWNGLDTWRITLRWVSILVLKLVP